MIDRREIEERVLGGLRERMMAPELVAAFVEEFNAELRRLAGEAEADYAVARRTIAEVERKIAGIVKAIEDGAYHPTLKERLTILEREKEVASAKLASSSPKSIVRLHPALPDIYRKKVENLAAALNEPGTAAEAGEIIRSLIDRIVLTPIDGQFKAEIFGDFARLVQFSQAHETKRKNAGSQGDPALLSVVAGTRNCLYLLLIAIDLPFASVGVRRQRALRPAIDN